MTLNDKITQFRTLIATRDDIDRQIAELLGDAALLIPPRKQQRKGKRGPNKTEHDEIEQAASRSKLDPAVTHDIEDRLIAGESVAAIHENVEVSAPTIYVIRARLKKEGRL